MSTNGEPEAELERFFSIVAHELRNPMTALQNALKIIHTLTAELHDDELDRFVTIAQRNADRILSVASRYLSTSVFSSGRIGPRFARLQLAPLLAAMVEDYRAPAASRGISLHTPPSTALPDVLADRDLLQQVLANLLDNACKWCRQGDTIELCARPNTTDIAISVADTGSGISAQEREHVFDLFYRHTAESTGSGIGLAVVRRLVQLMGGWITVEENQPRGTRFVFTVPRADAERRDPLVRQLLDAALAQARAQSTPLGIIAVEFEAPAPIDPSLLRRVETVLQGCLYRETDRLIPSGTGSSFVILCDTDAEGVRTICARMRQHLHSVSFAAQVSCGVGAAVFPRDGADAGSLLRKARSGDRKGPEDVENHSTDR